MVYTTFGKLPFPDDEQRKELLAQVEELGFIIPLQTLGFWWMPAILFLCTYQKLCTSRRNMANGMVLLHTTTPPTTNVALNVSLMKALGGLKSDGNK